MKVVSLILSAGESKRMGKPKALLDFDRKYCLGIVLEKCLASKAKDAVIVLGYAQAEIRKNVNLRGATVVINKNYQKGQTSSLKTGIKSLPKDAEAFLLFPVDLPLVDVSTINTLIAKWIVSKKAIAVPVFDNKHGHPSIFAKSVFDEFLALQDDEPAHTVLRKSKERVLEVACDDKGIIARMNTPEEYEECRKQYLKR